MTLCVQPLRDDLPFGVRVSGLTRSNIRDESVCEELTQLFETLGMIVFENVEPSSQMQVAISKLFGPLKEHPVSVVERVDNATMPGLIDMEHNPEDPYIIEIEGRQLSQWLPWHFDHCYNNELNRAGVLRAITIPQEGGLTGFADGVALYNAISPGLRRKIEEMNVIYTLDLRYSKMRFGRPESFREIRNSASQSSTLEQAKNMPRAIHPAVWQRESGEKVLHISPWMAVGLEGHENPEGDALLQAVCDEIYDHIQPYYHQWQPTDMVIWDNWRMLHCVSGHNPGEARRMHRTTIKGDYGLGYFENSAPGNSALEMAI